MSVSPWNVTKRGSRTVDVVVVGAGVAGASVCYWLKKHSPSLKVLLLDKTEIAAGATGKNAGFITCGSVEHFNRMVEKWGKDQAFEFWKFSQTNLELLKEHILNEETIITECEFQEQGSYSLASTDTELNELTKVHSLMSSFGINTESVNETEIQRRLSVVNFVGGIHYKDDCSVNPVHLTREIIKQSGAEVVPLTEVYDIQSNNGVSIMTSKGQIQCDVGIVALNGYLPQLIQNTSEFIHPTRGQMLMTEPVDLFLDGPCYANFVLDYFRQRPTGEVLIGGFRQLEKASEVGYSDHTTPVIQEALEQFLHKYIPVLKGKTIQQRWSGVMGFSNDGQPFIGSEATTPGLYYLGGFTAHGLGLAFHTAKHLVQMIMGEDFPEFLSARRFSK